MNVLARFAAGTVGGAVASGITYAITQQNPWWWAVGITAAALIWFGEYLADDLL